MKETYYAGAYWACRPESAEQCARRAETFFRLLSRCDPAYGQWFEKADSLEEALRLQFEPDFETLLHLFRKEENQEGEDGFGFGAWTGHAQRERGGAVSLHCGSEAEFVPNSCLLHLPKEQPGLERVLTAPVLAEVLRAMVLAWEPDWGVVVSGDFRDALRPDEDPRAILGWVTYLPHRRGELPALPGPVRVEPVEDKGTLLVLTPERLSAANPEHLALGRRVQELLDSRELLRPGHA